MIPMAILFALVGIAVITGTVLLASNRWTDPGLVDDIGDAVPPGLVDVPVGQLTPADIDQLQLDQAARGYRMSEVDAVVARLTAEIAEKEARLSQFMQVDDLDQPDSAGIPDPDDGVSPRGRADSP